MITKLTGILDEKSPTSVVIDVNGVGYIVYISKMTYQSLPQKNDKVVLYIQHIIRQEDQMLCGFTKPIEREWFNLLMTVQGVGAKVALSILSCLTTEEMAAHILKQYAKPFTEADGVGLKVANRIILELKNKIPVDESLDDRLMTQTRVEQIQTQNMVLNDTISALCNLGYSKVEVQKIVHAVMAEHPSAKMSELIRLSLQQIGRNIK
jgi:Holliday junction DNA helicase RuvA